MKRKVRKTILCMLSLLVCGIISIGIAGAATIESPSDGATINVNQAVKITVSPKISTSRVDYIYIRVYDEDNILVHNYDNSCEGKKVVEDYFLPTATGKYTIKTNTYYKIESGSTVSSGRTGEISINVVDVSSVKENKPKVEAVANGSGKVTLTISGNVSSYAVYRATSKDGKFSKIGTTKSGKYSDKNAGQKTYYYKVKGSASIGGKTYSTKYSSVVKVNAKISAFKADVTAELDGDYAKITVNNSPKAYGYKYYRATSIDGKYKLMKTTTKSTFVDETIGDKTYYYKVLPYAVVNDKKVNGKYSNSVELSLNNPNKPGKPEITVEQAYYEDGTLASGSFLVKFNKVENADTYKLYISKDGGKTYKYDPSGWYILKASDIVGDSESWWQRETVGKTIWFKLSASSKNFQNGEYEVFSEPVSYTVQ